MDRSDELIGWRTIGTIDLVSVSQVGISADYPQGGTVFVLSLAGLHMSHDHGSTWHRVATTSVAPLATAASVDVVVPGLVAVATGDIIVSSEIGRSPWRGQAMVDVPITAIALAHGRLLAAGGSDGTIWRGTVGDERLNRVTQVDGPVDVLRASAVTGQYWAVRDGVLLESSDQGSHWDRAELEDTIVDVADEAGHVVAVGAAGRIWRWTADDHRWQPDPDAGGLSESQPDAHALAVASQGDIVVGDEGGVSWRGSAGPLRHELGAPCLSIAARGDHAYAGTAGRGLWQTTDRGTTWRQLGLTDATLVGAITAAASGRLLATAVDQQASISDDGGRTWQKPVAATFRRPQATALAPSGAVVGIGDGSIHLADGTARALPAPDVTQLAVAEDAGGHIVAVASAHAAWTCDGATEPWVAVSLELGSGEVIEALRIVGGTPRIMAIAVRESNGVGVRIRLGERRWRSVGSGVADFAPFALASAGACYAATAESLWRPSRMSGEIFAREEPGLGSIVGIAVSPVDDDTLAVHTTGAIGLSFDGGLSWAELPLPRGAGATALSIRSVGPTTDLVACELGGLLLALPIDRARMTLRDRQPHIGAS